MGSLRSQATLASPHPLTRYHPRAREARRWERHSTPTLSEKTKLLKVFFVIYHYLQKISKFDRPSDIPIKRACVRNGGERPRPHLDQ